MTDEIIEGNKLIAEFMGIKLIKGFNERTGNHYYYYNNAELQSYEGLPFYDSEWGCLMPCFDKLSQVMDIDWKITSKAVHIYTHLGQPIGDFNGCWEINCPDNVIVDAWRGMVEFITWYNQKINLQ